MCIASQDTPYTLHPTPHTLHPTPYTLHPTPYAPNTIPPHARSRAPGPSRSAPSPTPWSWRKLSWRRRYSPPIPPAQKPAPLASVLPGFTVQDVCFRIQVGLKAGPFQGRQATEVYFAWASEASGGPCGELLRFCVQTPNPATQARAESSSACFCSSRVQGACFRIQGSGCRVHFIESRVPACWFLVPGSGFRVPGFGFRVSGFWLRVECQWSPLSSIPGPFQGSGFRVWGLGFGIWGVGCSRGSGFRRV